MPLLTLTGSGNYLDGGLIYQNIPTYLPKMYQTDAFARIPQLTGIVAESFDQLRLDQRTFEDLIDINRVPYGFLPKLAALIGLEIEQGTTDAQARKALWEAVEVYKIKGTTDSISRLLLKFGSYSVLIFPTYTRMFTTSTRNARLSGAYKIQGKIWRQGVYEVISSLAQNIWQDEVAETQPAGKLLIPNIVVAQSWQASHAYNTGDVVIPTTTGYNGRMFKCLNPGISLTVEPLWPPTGDMYMDGVTPDSHNELSGMVLWQNMGLITDLIAPRFLPTISWRVGMPITGGPYQAGSISYDTTSPAPSLAGWYCSTGGSPGTWIPFGSLGNASGTAGTGTLATIPYMTYGSTPPITGSFWGIGSIMINIQVNGPGFDGWKCVQPAGTTGGSGVWKYFGIVG